MKRLLIVFLLVLLSLVLIEKASALVAPAEPQSIARETPQKRDAQKKQSKPFGFAQPPALRQDAMHRMLQNLIKTRNEIARLYHAINRYSPDPPGPTFPLASGM